MCGICGYYKVDGIGRGGLEAMATALAHRGPDREGFYLSPDGRAGLGHRRLAILDLSAAGQQPMRLEGGGLWIAFNGEVFNFLELRGELEGRGRRFTTATDTEVILAAYREWGLGAFDRFNGMWALALFDEASGELLLCRDRFGVKPLYYQEEPGGGVLFASELKAFGALGARSPGWDVRSLAAGLTDAFAFEASGATLRQGVASLPPGHWLRAGSKGVEVRRWWSTLDHLEETPSSVGERAERFYDLFTDACRIRMRSDVPIGTALSGGLDSSAVVVCVASVARGAAGGRERMAASWQRAFHHSFPGTEMDETAYAEAVAGATGVELVPVVADESRLPEELDRIVGHLEAVYPGMPDSLWRVYQAQRANGVVVSLDGHGADEMLGGYDWHLSAAMASASPLSARYRELFRLRREMYAYGLPTRFRVRTVLQASPLAQAALEGLRRRWKGRFLSREGRRLPAYRPMEEALPRRWDRLQKVLYRDFHWLILPRILKNFDLMSMAHGVEVRMPFLDYRLVGYAFSLPSEAKISEEFTKAVLREAMRGRMPEMVRVRKTKVGFNSPVKEWLRGCLRPWVEDTLRTPSAAGEVLDLPKLKRFYGERILTGRAKYDEALTFWSCVSALRLTAKPV